MKRISMLAIALVIVVAFGIAPVQSRSSSSPILVLTVYDRYIYHSAGTGFVVRWGDGNAIVTAYHVATDINWRPVKDLAAHVNGKTIPVQVARTSNIADLVLLVGADESSQAELNALPTLDLAEAMPSEDDPLESKALHNEGYFIFSLDEGVSLQVSKLEFKGYYGSCCVDLTSEVESVLGHRWSKLFTSKEKAASGMSGSPIRDIKGRVVGVTVGAIGGVGLAVPLYPIQLLLGEERTRGDQATASSPTPGPVGQTGTSRYCTIFMRYSKECS